MDLYDPILKLISEFISSKRFFLNDFGTKVKDLGFIMRVAPTETVNDYLDWQVSDGILNKFIELDNPESPSLGYALVRE
ncbi:hypothetical protein COT60_02135 [Candidatus Pacearchaeota archaeon CG09_land_8_20_14_0_10_30_9]|nr:hypothetical protein [Candidatus Pacearchaeota archaeon]OIO40133.1 MAG: hypothetical protein AUJ61_02555 [Candidatus Pacearchaeota archaeon CG1_02_30_18]PIN71165.1 MAG: hypothetical protein COV77_03350 [Candidatus Pacearchaeota archaeon CG11_big_fil_rev_8_21_14_0_20_30_13]PIO01109.1 MAG: hypothetical protein COT60_02135 [Candidatus Pacearchaeota archaeon CG09_land_8_20_14_0_10_30_9]PIZ82013.1 MAG: hypothetical protein COX98_01555 [Candidatus Pacearchaeota archaeon CG_4_10_14_0_2_um_filter_30